MAGSIVLTNYELNFICVENLILGKPGSREQTSIVLVNPFDVKILDHTHLMR